MQPEENVTAMPDPPLPAFWKVPEELKSDRLRLSTVTEESEVQFMKA